MVSHSSGEMLERVVRFAMFCDACQARGPEYDSGFAALCSECDREPCDRCAAASGHTKRDDGSGREWWEEE